MIGGDKSNCEADLCVNQYVIFFAFLWAKFGLIRPDEANETNTQSGPSQRRNIIPLQLSESEPESEWRARN